MVRVAYQTDLVLTERLVAADPTNTQWQHDLSVSYDKLGDLAMEATRALRPSANASLPPTAPTPNGKWQCRLAASG